MRRSLFALVLSACAAMARAGTFTTIEVIEYANVDGTSLLMDLRVPDDEALHPVIVYLHSGAWITGDRTGGPAIREASRGFAVASIDYRLAPKYTWPAQIEDCKAAVRWLRANAARYRLDPKRIAVFGTSAGGPLAARPGTTPDPPAVEGPSLGDPPLSRSVEAAIGFLRPPQLPTI